MIHGFKKRGGTPTSLEAEELDWLLNRLEETFDLSGIKELTVEAM